MERNQLLSDGCRWLPVIPDGKVEGKTGLTWKERLFDYPPLAPIISHQPLGKSFHLFRRMAWWDRFPADLNVFYAGWSSWKQYSGKRVGGRLCLNIAATPDPGCKQHRCIFVPRPCVPVHMFFVHAVAHDMFFRGISFAESGAGVKDVTCFSSHPGCQKRINNFLGIVVQYMLRCGWSQQQPLTSPGLPCFDIISLCFLARAGRGGGGAAGDGRRSARPSAWCEVSRRTVLLPRTFTSVHGAIGMFRDPSCSVALN